MDFNIICNKINYFLIDKDIIINENDNFIIKLKYFLLKYKRIIAIVLLIILLIIGYQCNLSIFSSNNSSNRSTILNGGYNSLVKKAVKESKIAEKTSKTISKVGSAVKSGAQYAKANPGKAIAKTMKYGASGAYSFAANRGQDIKEFAPWIYEQLYSISVFILVCIIFMPLIGFFIIGIICYTLLKDKIGYIKGL